MRKTIVNLILILILGISVFKIISQWNKVYDLHKANILSKSKWSISNSTERDWIDIGAFDVKTDYVFGYREIYFMDYYIKYQAFDERDDILGGIVEKRTGEEHITIYVSFFNNRRIYSNDFEKDIYFYSVDNSKMPIEIMDAGDYVVDKNSGIKIYDRHVADSCRKLVDGIKDFEKKSNFIFEKLYLNEINLAIKYSVYFLLIVLIVCLLKFQIINSKFTHMF